MKNSSSVKMIVGICVFMVFIIGYNIVFGADNLKNGSSPTNAMPGEISLHILLPANDPKHLVFILENKSNKPVNFHPFNYNGNRLEIEFQDGTLFNLEWEADSLSGDRGIELKPHARYVWCDSISDILNDVVMDKDRKDKGCMKLSWHVKLIDPLKKPNDCREYKSNTVLLLGNYDRSKTGVQPVDDLKLDIVQDSSLSKDNIAPVPNPPK